jgi:hypothetical protein
MNKSLFILLCCFGIIASACKRQKITATPTVATENTEFTVQEIDFNYFNSKSKITYKDAENNLTATVNIRMKKDSIIWLSISKVGVEGVRSMITQDSIFVADKLKNEYTNYDFKSLSEKFGFTITFDLLQAAILGNLPMARKKEKVKLIKEKDFYLLRQNDQQVTIDNYISADNMKLKKILMVEQPTNNSLTLDYENFSMLNNFLFPYSSLISLQYQSSQGYYNTLVTIQHLKAEISDKELKFPFNVPQKYDRK